MNREDLEWCGKAFLAFCFAALMGVLLTIFYGYLVIRLLMSAFFGAS